MDLPTMDLPKNGESSRSSGPAASSSVTAVAAVAGTGVPLPLILPVWDTLPTKHLHSSLDLISLLHLDGLYNTYVRPYFDPVPDTDDEGDGGATGAGAGATGGAGAAASSAGGGAPGAPGGGGAPGGRPRARKKQGLSKGYVALLEDCIDPIPMGNQAEHSLLPLVGDFLDPARPPTVHWDGPLVPLTSDQLSSARLEQGKTDGYANGEKVGVREAEERRRRKKQARLSQSVAPDLPDLAAGSPAPGGVGGTPGGPGAGGVPTPAPPSRGTPRPPFSVRARPGGQPGTPSHAQGGQGQGAGRPAWPPRSAPPGAGGGYHPRAGGPGTPGTPTHRPGQGAYGQGAGGPGPRPPGTPGTPLKRPGDGSGYPAAVKRAKGLGGGGGSRSASPSVGDVGVKAVFKGQMRRTEEP